MLSGELATLLAGRYVEFAIYPFSYTEFLGITQKENNKIHYLEYMQSRACLNYTIYLNQKYKEIIYPH